jgi:hypothetical protein
LSGATPPSSLKDDKEAAMLKSMMLKRTLAAIAAGCMMVPYLPAQQAATPADAVKIARDTLLQVTLMQPLDPATVRPGDDVPLRLTRSLIVDAVVVLPAGSVVHGKVTKVTPAGRHCTNGAVKWKLESVPLPDGSTLKTEVSRAFLYSNPRVPPPPKQQHSADEIVGYVIQDAVLLPLVVPGLAIYEARKAVTAPFQHGRCSRWKDPPLPADTTVMVRIREDHEVRVSGPASP